MRQHGNQLMVAAALVAAPAVAIILGQTPTPAGVYTTEQAVAGRLAYEVSCASCHQTDLAGANEAPPLAGGNFMNTWRSRTTRDLFSYMQTTMPPENPGRLGDQTYLTIVAYILEANGAPAGTQALTPATSAAIG